MITAALLLAAQASAQAPSTTPRGGDQAIRSQGASATSQSFLSGLKQRGLSNPGVRSVAAVEAGTAPAVQQALANLRAANQEVVGLARASSIDVARLNAALGRRDGARAELASIRTNAFVETLRMLAPADRTVFVRALGLAPAPGPASQQRP
jgi:hypothetical protein